MAIHRLIAPLVLLAFACNKRAEPEKSAPPADVDAPSAPDTHFLDEAASRAATEIETLESTKDVTCWTSFRQLDGFISAAQYSNFATLPKITAIESLTRAVWEKASLAAAGPKVTAAELRAAAPIGDDRLLVKRAGELPAFAKELGLKAYKDYRTTSEDWRVVLAVIEAEILGGVTPLKPLADDAFPALADLATRLSLVLLQSAGTLARDERSPFIEGAHVKRAHADIAKEFALVNKPVATKPLPDAQITERLAPLTRRLIEGKTKALQIFNKDTKDLTRDLNRVSKVPLLDEAVDVWMKDLQSFAHFVAGGYDPMQADNFLSDGSFAGGTQPRKPFVDAPRAENATLQLFPHVIMPNGDVHLRFEPNPGQPSERPRKAYDEVLLDYRQNAVRDTAVHWIVLGNVHRERPFAMDPFAAEYTSEVISMMMTEYLVRAEKLAKASSAASIDKAIAKKVRDKEYVMVMPRAEEAKPWPKELWDKKAAVLAQYQGALFADVTKESGLPTSAPELPALTPQQAASGFDIQKAMGAGIAVGDVNGDGYPDLFYAGEGMGRLYVNRGKGTPGTFTDATASFKIPPALDDSHGALFFDLDGDGDQDLLVLRSEHPSLLLRQDAPGTFVDASEALGFRAHKGAHVASVFDYDKDGDLDIYVGYYGSDAVNRRNSKETNLPTMDGRNGSPHELWRRGADGKYTDVGAQAGVADTGWTLATSTFDYDNDGDLDLFLANDFGPDTFFRNKGDGTFEDVSKRTQTDDRGSGMNVSFTDVNGDGWLDFYVSNIDMFSKNMKVVYPTDSSPVNGTMDEALQRSFQYISGNKLFVNPADPAGQKPFIPEQATRFEPGDRGWGWAAIFFDYENDGDDDMYLSNGWLEGSVAGDQKKQLFLQDGGAFFLAPPSSPEAYAGNSRGVVAVDLDRDGDLDLAVNNFRQAPVVLKNLQRTANQTIRLRLRGKAPNTNAVGARVTAVVAGKSHIHEVTCGLGYLGQDEETIPIGIGKQTSADVTVRWPGGALQKVGQVAAGEIVVVTQP
jgi:hypothetical protein